MILMALALAVEPIDMDAANTIFKTWKDCTLNTALDIAKGTNWPPETIADGALGSCLKEQMAVQQWRWDNNRDRLTANSYIELDVANRRRALILAAIIVRQRKDAGK